jgi:hypothetical protein
MGNLIDIPAERSAHRYGKDLVLLPGGISVRERDGQVLITIQLGLNEQRVFLLTPEEGATLALEIEKIKRPALL